MPLAHFPAPKRDELPYSMLARLRQDMNGPGSTNLLLATLGSAAAFPTTLATNMTGLAWEAYGDKRQARMLVERHTAYHYLTAFLPAVERMPLMQSLLLKGGGGRRYGLTGTTPHTHLLFCPDCAAADAEETERQAAWRRHHQLPGVYVCAQHGTALLLGPAPAKTYALIMCPTSALGGKEIACPFTQAAALKLAKLSYEALDGQFGPYERDTLKSGMRALLAEHRVRLDHNGGPAEIECMVRETLSGQAAKALFGEDVIPPRLHLTYRKSASGRSAPPLSYLCILAALDSALTDLAACCQLLKTECRPRSKPARAAPFSEKRFEACKAKFLRARIEQPDVSRTALWTTVAPVETRYIARHDPDWLEARLPATRSRVNWASVDAELASKVPEALSRLLASTPPKRVTKATLAAKISTTQRLAVSGAHLPLTVSAIMAAVESPRAATLRRMEWLAIEASKTGVTVSHIEMRFKARYDPLLAEYADSLVEALAVAAANPDPTTHLLAAIALMATKRRRLTTP